MRYALESFRMRDEADAFRIMLLQCIGGSSAVDVWLSAVKPEHETEDGRTAEEIVGDVVARAGLVMNE